MDTPVFHLDGMGNRLLITIIAITHMVIHHPMVAGAFPLITALEWRGISKQDRQWDQLAKRITLITLLIVSSIGAVSAVGVWLSSALVSPIGVGSLLRLSFWNWFTQWSVFISEVMLIVAYYWTWDSWQGQMKRWHIVLGFALSIFSWVAMAIIVAILGFKMSTGSWSADSSLFEGTLNPLFISQLAFRTFFSFASAGLYIWFLTAFLVDRKSSLREPAIRLASIWILFFSPLCMAAAYWYWTRVPAEVAENLSVGSLTQQFAIWQSQFLYVAAGTIGAAMLIAACGWKLPQATPRIALLASFLMMVGFLEHFERACEFMRKPYIIAGYLYSNGVRVDELALLQHEGILTHSAYSHVHPISDNSRAEAGRHVFLLTCTRCHTTGSINGVVGKLEKLYGQDPWDPKQIEILVGSMHTQRKYMPPFPGNADESRALASYLCELQKSRNGEPLSSAARGPRIRPPTIKQP